MAVIVGQPL